jgi:hypothetical protein
MSGIWMTSILLQWIVIALLCAVILSLVRQLGVIGMEINGLREAQAAAGENGSEAGPQVYSRFETARAVPLADGASFELGGQRPRPTVVVFFSPTCGSCALLPEALRELSVDAERGVDLLAVVSLDRSAVGRYAQEQGLGSVPMTSRGDFPEDILPKGGVPLALAISADGTVAARGQPKTAAHLREMALAAAQIADIATHHSRRRHEWGESAPYWTEALTS